MEKIQEKFEFAMEMWDDGAALAAVKFAGMEMDTADDWARSEQVQKARGIHAERAHGILMKAFSGCGCGGCKARGWGFITGAIILTKMTDRQIARATRKFYEVLQSVARDYRAGRIQ